jgi:endo-1,4-beta-xylanase
MKQKSHILLFVFTLLISSLFLAGQDDAGPTMLSDAEEPIAFGQSKFIGNIYSPSQWPGFTKYWNQVTPENAGKWGSVEKYRDNMSWANLDAAYRAAKDHNMPFRMHVLVWGNQQPSWIENLSLTEKREEIQEWFEAVAARYPDIDWIEVVNEPLHDPPNQSGNGGGNYCDALGGSGETGWDWVLKAFRYARNAFPDTRLALNEYNIVNSPENTNRYLEIIELLRKDSLIDAIGVQAHAFSLNTSPATLTANLNKLAATGLPIYVTELDIDGPTDQDQLVQYRQIFPVFWNHPSVQGITLWGYRPGMWRTSQKAYLIQTDGKERPALQWLRAYVNGTFVEVSSIVITSENGDASIEVPNGTLQLIATLSPENVTFPGIQWGVVEEGFATINAEGLLTAQKNGTVNVVAEAVDGSRKRAYFRVTLYNQESALSEQFRNYDTQITVFPNPVTNGTFTIQGLQEIKEIQAIAPDGKKIRLNHTPHFNSAQIQLDAAPGLYFLQIRVENFTHTRKLIVN